MSFKKKITIKMKFGTIFSQSTKFLIHLYRKPCFLTFVMARVIMTSQKPNTWVVGINVWRRLKAKIWYQNIAPYNGSYKKNGPVWTRIYKSFTNMF